MVVCFNPQQVLGVAATVNPSHHKSIIDERVWQDLVYPGRPFVDYALAEEIFSHD